ncbi:flagellar motor protein MotB [Anaerocolumna sp. AGMB13020]|uniref:flagellar motor protein MotB n=1 Tax=Anaerocolumna sp. AGMB13020 TaxID=3081750 RepID=UPI002952F095|nr:flagellar motor protein MotB [Anaerocolumna sp. AGMB13020]WOO36538.1 flagellar motor protein MotB [Anaerocolumna sp. AGMB13020]
MSRRKMDDNEENDAPWLNTFADLMNLLLCFFVLLFAASNVDSDKYQAISDSMSKGIGFFSGINTPIINDDNGNKISHGENDGGYNDSLIPKKESSSEVGSESKSNDQQLTDVEEKLQQRNKEQTMEMYENISNLAEEYDIDNDVVIITDSNYRYVQISISGSILFDSGKAEIKKEAIPLFNKLGDVLQSYKNYHIELEGHTDNRPMRSNAYPDNNWLSSARALNAATYLINEKGMSPDTLSWSGRGEYDPVASNSSEEGRAKNRRVEIKIYNKYN